MLYELKYGIIPAEVYCGIIAALLTDGDSLSADLAGDEIQLAQQEAELESATGVAACPTNSFSADTPVLMADGKKKAIKDVQVGDEV